MECRKPQKRKNLRLLILTTNLSKPGHDVAGLFFCLASAEGAGLLFCPAAMHPYTSVYSEFCAVHATIPPTQQNSARGFTEAFPAICRIFSLLCGGVSSYTAPPATRWSISQRRSTSSEYQIPAPRRTLYRPAQPPYYNKVYKGAPLHPVMDPCQKVQQILDHASPAGWIAGKCCTRRTC